MHRELDIVNWADRKGILEKGDSLTQGLKTLEEVAEVISDILKGKDPSIELGDVYVTIVIQAALNYTTIQDCRVDARERVPERETLKEQLADLVLDTALMLEGIQSNDVNTITKHIGNIYEGIEIIAHKNIVSLKSCIELAYQKINKRTGKMVDGVFINESK